MLRYNNVGVLMGGGSAERQVSLNSGRAVVAALRQLGLRATPFDPSEQPVWALEKAGFDVAFIALHGGYGENGTIQAALELMGLPYTGSGVRASAIAMDKWLTKVLWRAAGLPTPHAEIVTADSDFEKLEEQLGLPLFLKPTAEGSSIGVVKVAKPGELRQQFAKRQSKHGTLLAEKAMLGGEYTVAIVADRVLPIIKIVPAGDFYDYDAKYVRDDTQYLCPSDLPVDKVAHIQREALRAFKAVGCSGWGRVDFLLDSNGDHHFLEINTAPGMTDHSLVPMAAKAQGLSFAELVRSILMSASFPV